VRVVHGGVLPAVHCRIKDHLKVRGPLNCEPNMAHEFIFVPDLAETLIALSEKEEAYGKAWNVAGSGLITTRQFAEFVFGTVHQKPRLRVAGKFMLRILGLFNPFLRQVVEMHYLWTTPVKLDDTRLRQLLPNLHKTPYAEGIRLTIDVMRTDGPAARV
jgi:nucleoside-diphosphate-sugar epimerase